MEDILSKVPTELILGISTFILGYLAHLRNLSESKDKTEQSKEKNRLHFYELELESIAERQKAVQEFMEKSIERLENERDKLTERVIRLQTKIERLESENLDWQMKYIEILKKCDPSALK